MKITLRDPIGNSIVVDAGPADIVPLQNYAKKHSVPNAPEHPNEYLVNDVFAVIAEHLDVIRKP